ncbi:uncharacterized protein LOC112450829 [Kryptolebias marmoratus]|uniref:uncharacterized protein LOC112450829 n=1 Tax=Kryptolebias marmoratus TaxID=37003 RepID=UPI000D530EDA|nr:uncharacterized protein LOC112450829 [Kryptolebias marmoratus]
MTTLLMDGLYLILIFLSGVVSCSHDAVPVSVLEETVRPGDNITLYCDCKVSTGVYIVWYRNCSHQNQPTLVLRVKDHFSSENTRKFPRLTFKKNDSSDSYDLVITNATKSDEGLYNCGTEETIVLSEYSASPIESCRYSTFTTRLTLDSHGPDRDSDRARQDCGSCCKLLFSLLPAVSIFFILLSSFLVVLLSRKKVKNIQDDEKRHDTMGKTEEEQDGDTFYAALETHELSQRPKKKKTPQSSDFSTYSAVIYTSSVEA